VFSIEPGIYLAGWGGVRIENLVTVVEDRKVPGFLRVQALTFSPLDRRLIDGTLLSADEKAWLRQYQRGKA
jgi:Xaa-Pro aminopeptidase